MNKEEKEEAKEAKLLTAEPFKSEVVDSREIDDNTEENLVRRERDAWIVWDTFERAVVKQSDTEHGAEIDLERLLDKSSGAHTEAGRDFRYEIVEVPVRAASFELEVDDDDDRKDRK